MGVKLTVCIVFIPPAACKVLGDPRRMHWFMRLGFGLVFFGFAFAFTLAFGLGFESGPCNIPLAWSALSEPSVYARWVLVGIRRFFLYVDELLLPSLCLCK